MAEFGRVLWLWFAHNQRPVPKTREQWLGILLTLCITGFSLQIAGKVLAPPLALALAIGLVVVTVVCFVCNRFDSGVLTWALLSVAGAGTSLWVWLFPVSTLLALALLISGILCFEVMGHAEYTRTTEQMQAVVNGGFFKTIVPGPALGCIWLWFGNGLDWWLMAPAAGFLFSTVNIFRHKVLNWWDSNEDPLNPA